MPYRKFDTGTWQDPWFEDLSPKAKLAFIYFWTNETCTQAGIYEISEKRIKFELGYGIDTIYSELDTKIFWENTKKTIWVKNFFKRQCQNHKFAISALNSIKDDPYKLSIFIEYNQGIIESFVDKNGDQIIDLSTYEIDTIPIPYLTVTEQNRTEAVQNSTVTEQTDMSSSAPPKLDFKLLVSQIFEYWKETLDHPRAKLDKIRKKRIMDRLKDGYSIDDIKLAIDGCLASPYHQGENKQGAVYDDLELICRDSKHVDQFIKSANEPDAKLISAKGRQARKNGNTWLQMRQAKREAQNG